jgi:hypothetical protein
MTTEIKVVSKKQSSVFYNIEENVLDNLNLIKFHTNLINVLTQANYPKDSVKVGIQKAQEDAIAAVALVLSQKIGLNRTLNNGQYGRHRDAVFCIRRVQIGNIKVNVWIGKIKRKSYGQSGLGKNMVSQEDFSKTPWIITMKLVRTTQSYYIEKHRVKQLLESRMTRAIEESLSA